MWLDIAIAVTIIAIVVVCVEIHDIIRDDITHCKELE